MLKRAALVAVTVVLLMIIYLIAMVRTDLG